MKIFKKVLAFLILALCFSCEDGFDLWNLKDISFIDCNECTLDEPQEAYLEIKLEKLYKYMVVDPVILINVYEGNLEDNLVYRSIQTTNNETKVNVPLNKKYTITAEYNIINNTYIAINSVTPHVKYNKHNCDEPCYYIVDKSVNLKLKYIK